MPQLVTLTDIESELARHIPLVKEMLGKNMTLERMWPLMNAVGNPEKKLKVVHIAGTSGKTSTTYYIAALLMEAGMKVGVTVSPHVDSVTERIQINLKPIGEQDFVVALNEFLSIIEEAGINPTYFELLIAFAYWYFVKCGVDYAVIETGMGGLHDGTNVAECTNKVCVITDIGYDHMQVLGTTLTAIALQKAGIIHEDNHALMFQQSVDVMQVLNEWADKKHAHLEVLDPSDTVSEVDLQVVIDLMPQYQQRNWLLAYRTFQYVQQRDSLPDVGADELARTIHTLIPGRMDTVTVGGKTIIMDGAHNGQKMLAFVSSFEKRYPGQKAAVMIGLKQDKQFDEVLPLLLPITSILIVTTFSANQDIPSASIDPTALASEASVVGFREVVIEPDCNLAYELLQNQKDDIVIITGSFYLIGQLRHSHKELRNA